MLRDIRIAARTLRRSLSFTLVSVGSMTIGFALMASTVAVVNAYLIRSLPYAAAERLYHLRYAPPGPWEPRGMSGLDWTSVNDVVEFPITSLRDTYYVSELQYAQSLNALRVSHGFIEGLGVRPILGRALVPADYQGSPERAALISHALWRDQYGADPAAVGRTLAAVPETTGRAAETFRIVGVLPHDFYYGRDGEVVHLLVPLTSAARTYMVRLREGVPPAYAEARITEAARRAGTDIPANWGGVQLESAHGRYAAQVRPVLTGITVASALVLIIVCANVAMLMLLRTSRRQKEMAVRTALGASRARVARLVVVESALVCLGAMVLGLLLTSALLEIVAPFVEAQLGRPAPGGSDAIAIDTTVFLITGAIGITTALSISLLAAIAPWRRQLTAALRRDGHTGSDTPSTRRLRAGLVAFEVAGTLVLLIGCASLVQSVIGMLRADLGFDQDRLVRSRVVLRGADYPDAAAFAKFYDEFTRRLSASARAQVVFASWPPFAELPTQLVEVDGRPGSPAGGISVGAGYFNVLSIPLRNGREFQPSEVAAEEPVAVISQTLGTRLWGSGSPIGEQLRVIEETPAGRRAGPWRTVVGVAADVRQSYADRQVADVYVPLKPAGRFGSFYLRTDQPLPSLLASMRATAAELDPHAMIGTPATVSSQNRELAGTTFLTTMLTVFAGIAAFLAVLGIYGVTAYAAEQRRREIAIRMAVGASAADVVRLFLSDGARVLALGVVFGLFGASAMARLLQDRLFSVSASDPGTMAIATVLLVGTGVFATWWPARRASRGNPIVALKEG